MVIQSAEEGFEGFEGFEGLEGFEGAEEGVEDWGGQDEGEQTGGGQKEECHWCVRYGANCYIHGGSTKSRVQAHQLSAVLRIFGIGGTMKGLRKGLSKGKDKTKNA